MNIAPTITVNSKILLRKPIKSDIEQRLKYGRPAEFVKNVGGSTTDIPPYTMKNATSFYNREMGYKYSWIIEYEEKVIGVCRLKEKESDFYRYSIGIFDPSLYSKGIGTRVTISLIDFTFTNLKAHTIDLMVLEFNKRAIHMYEKCGFKKKLLLENHHEVDGKTYNDIIMEIKK